MCGGAGFVRRELPLGHPEFGRAVPCQCVLFEADEARRARLSRISNLAQLSRFTFDTLTEAVPGLAGITTAGLERAAAYAASPEGWVVISGPSGSGKTVLAAAIANARIKAGEPALFLVVPDLLDHLRAGYTAGAEDLSYAQVLDQVRTAPFLVLDDIDAAAPTDWAREKLFQVVNHRYISELPTVFTCADPARLDTRLATRLTGVGVAQLRLGGPLNGSCQEVGGLTRDRVALMTFANFDLRGSGLETEERDSLAAAERTAREYAERPRGFLTLLGRNGCGKTHLAAAVANRVLANGGSVFLAVVPDLLDQLRASFTPGKEAVYDETLEHLRAVDLLVLDDLGSQATSPWAQEKLFQVVNYRTLAGKATVVTSDLETAQLAAAHPRIAARIFDPHVGVVMPIWAPHYSLGRAAVQPAPRAPRRTR